MIDPDDLVLPAGHHPNCRCSMSDTTHVSDPTFKVMPFFLGPLDGQERSFFRSRVPMHLYAQRGDTDDEAPTVDHQQPPDARWGMYVRQEFSVKRRSPIGTVAVLIEAYVWAEDGT